MTVLELRKNLRVSQVDFTKIVGVSHNRLHRHENGGGVLSDSEIEHIRKESKNYMLREIDRYNSIVERMSSML